MCTKHSDNLVTLPIRLNLIYFETSQVSDMLQRNEDFGCFKLQPSAYFTECNIEDNVF